MSPSTPPRSERRLSPRRNTNIAGQIGFGGKRIACVVRNISDSGAKLELTGVRGVPDRFTLLVPGHAPQPCRVIWRALREMGVQYISG